MRACIVPQVAEPTPHASPRDLATGRSGEERDAGAEKRAHQEPDREQPNPGSPVPLDFLLEVVLLEIVFVQLDFFYDVFVVVRGPLPGWASVRCSPVS